jgi:hypothetical protein
LSLQLFGIKYNKIIFVKLIFILEKLFGTNIVLIKIHTSNTYIIMGNLLYIIAVILVIAWLIGFIGFHVGMLIHLLLILAIIAILLRIIRGQKIL